MAFCKHSSELLPERRGIVSADFKSLDQIEQGLRAVRKTRRFGRISGRRLLWWIFSLAALFSIYLAVFGLKLLFHGEIEGTNLSLKDTQKDSSGSDVFVQFQTKKTPHRPLEIEGSNLSLKDTQKDSSGSDVLAQFQTKKTLHRPRFVPCEVGFQDSVDHLVEPENIRNFTQFSLKYVEREEKTLQNSPYEPRFGGHQTLVERENSFHANNQTIHCGFMKGTEEFPSTGFDLDEKDKAYMSTCRVVVSSCIFGSSDFLRRPASKLISMYSKASVCFVMFVDEKTLMKLSTDGNSPDDRGHIGLWRIVVVKNFPYEDMRKTGKVPKFLSHRLFPSSRYSIWLDSKMRLQTDPMLILEYFLWRNKSEYAISNHYARHCVWDEVLQNKRLNKYNHTAIDEQFMFYQSDGLTKFDHSDPNTPLPSYVPEGSFIVRAHTPMSNLFSCLWFNEVDRFTSRDQLSFAYTFLKLKRMNPKRPFYLNMFKDCERRALAKLFRHRTVPPPPPS